MFCYTYAVPVCRREFDLAARLQFLTAASAGPSTKGAKKDKTPARTAKSPAASPLPSPRVPVPETRNHEPELPNPKP
jgi:hypothetical protein